MIELNERKKELFDISVKLYKAGVIADPRYSLNSLKIIAGKTLDASEAFGLCTQASATDNEKNLKKCKQDFALILGDIINTILTIAAAESLDIEKAVNESYYKTRSTEIKG